MITYRMATPADLSAVLQIWERSVRATHHFLTQTDIDTIKKELQVFLPEVELVLAVMTETDTIVGFGSVGDKCLTMLFLDKSAIGKGIGSRFFDYLLTRYPFTRLEVNKDNPQALAFYLRKGFRVVAEKLTDDEGRPFPILVMEK